jgi:transcription factor C subunit 7
MSWSFLLSIYRLHPGSNLLLTPQLAQYGLHQATALAEFLSSASPRPERVFSSAFYRCIQTAIPTAESLKVPVSLEHGVGEWYSTVNPNTGLHPRPAGVTHLAQHFPDSSLDMEYEPTVFPSRRGESLKDLQNRADLFVEAWTSRVEDQYKDVKCVVIFAHAASVIALGRAVGYSLPLSAFSSADSYTDNIVDRKQGIRRISRMRNDITLPPEDP